MDNDFEENHEWGSDVIITTVVGIVVFIVILIAILVTLSVI